MNTKHKYFLPVLAIVVLLQVSAIKSFAQAPAAGGQPRPGGAAPGAVIPGGALQGGPGGGREPLAPIPLAEDTTRRITRNFTVATAIKKAPDARGFLQRWLVLEPVKKNLRNNSGITEEYLKTTFANENFSQDYNAVPKAGQTVKIGTQTLKWYALDSKSFNFNLHQFSYATRNALSGIMFWNVNGICLPQEIKNLPLGGGGNSGGAFWLNGEKILNVPGDKDIIVDNVASPLVTLKKGRNILRAAVINGQGMCNFAARFVDEAGNPVTNYTTSVQ